MMHSSHREVKIYTPLSVLREPRSFARQAIKDLISSFSIALAIFYRDFSAKYRQTFAGYFNALIPVLITTISFVFLEKSNVVNFSEKTISYGSFVFINSIFWELFSESCGGPTREVQNNVSSIIRLNFPRESIFLASFFNVLASLTIKLFITLFFLYFLEIKVTWNLLCLIPYVVGLISWGLLIGLLVLPVSILYSDFRAVIDVTLRLLFFLTPITYQIDYESLGHKWVTKYNFLGYYFTGIKEVVFYGQIPSDFYFILQLTLASTVSLIFGWILYRISLPILIERMPS